MLLKEGSNMLALTRRVGERIVIGDNVVVTIVDIKGDSIRLAIDAPKEIKIYRGEIFDAIAAENKEAAVQQIPLAFDALKGFNKK